MTPDKVATSIELVHQQEVAQQIDDLYEGPDDISEKDDIELQMLVSSGQLDAALTKILSLQAAAARGAFLNVNASGGSIADSSLRNAVEGRSATGRYVDGPMVSLIGEAGAEVVLPLTNPGRMAALLADPRVGPRVLKALGIHPYAQGGLVGSITASDGVMSTILNSRRTGGSTASQDSIQPNMHETGAIDDTTYRAYLASRLGDFEQYSDEWTSVWREKGLDDDETQRQADKAKAAEDAANAEVVAEDQKYAAMYELGIISGQQYEAYLQSRLGSFEIYSSDWMTRWRELSNIQQQAERDAQDRANQEAEDALKRLDILYDKAEARRQLAVAERTLGESWQDVSDARSDFANATTDDERNRANQRVADALNRVADDAFAGAQARAKTNGLEEGTAEYARFVRGEVEGYASAHPELGPRLNEWLAGLPRFARGGRASGWGIAGENGMELINFGQGADVYNSAQTSRMMSAMAYGLSSGTRPSSSESGGLHIEGGIHVGTRQDLTDTRKELTRLQWRSALRGI